ncbi:Type II secretion system F domain-containing protein [Idiomarina xiamenensis 10-D-4]|uniref:Type II secretion system F domain-containing protein n=2 Tax=Idiomarina xiamenensis TaxID=1207041 RepID=K2KSF6_9GAMM|nr:Type II secretion system F domain-containing protein [Idiomarina xiamenensis 10-D-4]
MIRIDLNQQQRIWQWWAETPDGRLIYQRQRSISRQQLLLQLRQQSLLNIRAQTVSAHNGFQRLRQKTQFSEALATLAQLLEAGLALLQACQLLCRNYQKNNTSRQLWALFSHCNRRIQQGLSFTQALADFPELLNAQQQLWLQLSETQGQLVSGLQQLQKQLEQQRQWTQQCWRVASYPLLSLMLCAVLAVAMLLWLVPQFELFFAERERTALPLLTQWLLHASQCLRQRGLTAAALLVLLALAAYYQRRYFIKCLLRLPAIRGFRYTGQLRQLSQALAQSLTAGVTLTVTIKYLQALDIIDAKRTLTALRQGQSLAAALRVTGQLPSWWLNLIEHAEHGGFLSKACQRASTLLSAQLTQQVAVFLRWAEPLLLLVVALIVGTILLALYLPLFQLGQGIV